MKTKKKIKVKVKVKKDCSNCANFWKIAEGHYVCEPEFLAVDIVKLLIDGSLKTDHYFYCGGSKWIEVN